MLTVGIKVLKNKLSEYVRLANAGETVLVSDRDKVVAELGPPSPSRERHLPDAMLADAVRNGFISPAVGSVGPPPKAPALGTLKEVLEGLESDRQER
ncbi:MAG: type II toxin-antitoxin system Phd/YefM family antitoxin [Actinomycetota bacterium]